MNKYYKPQKDDLLLTDYDQINRIIEQAMPSGKALLYQANLGETFFDLSTKLAGEFLQKLINYRIKTAIVASRDSISSEKFKEMMNELESSAHVRFFESEDLAIEWLGSE